MFHGTDLQALHARRSSLLAASKRIGSHPPRVCQQLYVRTAGSTDQEARISGKVSARYRSVSTEYLNARHRTPLHVLGGNPDRKCHNAPLDISRSDPE